MHEADPSASAALGFGVSAFFFQLLGSFCCQEGAWGVGIGMSMSSTREPAGRTNALAFILGVLGQLQVGAVFLGMFSVPLRVWGPSEADAS